MSAPQVQAAGDSGFHEPIKNIPTDFMTPPSGQTSQWLCLIVDGRGGPGGRSGLQAGVPTAPLVPGASGVSPALQALESLVGL